MIKIDDRIAMYSEEMTGIQQALEVFHGLANQMSRISHMQPNMVSERLHPQDVFNPYQDDLFTALCRHASQETRPVRGLLMVARSFRGREFSACANDLRLGGINSNLQLVDVKRFDQQIAVAEANGFGDAASYAVTIVAGGDFTPKASQLDARLVSVVCMSSITRSGSHS